MLDELVVASILYNPKNDVWIRFKGLVDQGLTVFLFDNSPDRTNIPKDLLVNSSLKYFSCGNNVGIGSALRAMCSTAYLANYKYLLFFDQDTIFTDDTIDYILNFFQLVSAKEIININGKSIYFSSVTFRDRKSTSLKYKIIFGSYKLTVVNFTINSGCLFFLDAVKKIGWHDPSYFIDGVDYSYCLNAKKKGFSIAEVEDTPGLDHSSEQDDKTYKIFGYTFSGRRYPLYRRRDFYKSSAKLIAATMRIDFLRIPWLLRSIVIYALQQLLIPFLVEDSKIAKHEE